MRDPEALGMALALLRSDATRDGCDWPLSRIYDACEASLLRLNPWFFLAAPDTPPSPTEEAQHGDS